MELDLDASLKRLADWLAQARKSKWSPTPEGKRLLDLANHLDATADKLREFERLQLECFVDGLTDVTGALLPPTHGCDVDGNPLGREVQHGRYSGTVARLREIADKAREQADALPNSRAKPELEYATDVFIHLWYEAGMPLPSLYVTGEATETLGETLRKAGAHLSPERALGLLSDARKKFDALRSPPEFSRFLVWRQ